VASSASQAIPTSGGSVVFPAAGGITATFVFAAGVPAGTTITGNASTTAPSGAPAPSSERRSIKAIAGAVPIQYLSFTVSQGFSATLLTSILLSLASSDPAGASYYIEFDDLTAGTKLGTVGPDSDVSGTVTFPTGGSDAPTLSTTDTYLAQFYYVPAGSASPSPVASSSPAASPSPSAAASVAPTSSPSTAASPSASPSSSPSSSPSASPSGSSGDGLGQFLTFDGGADVASCVATTAGACSALSSTDGAVTVSATFPSVPTSASSTPLDLYIQVATSVTQSSPAGVLPNFTGTGTVYAYLVVYTGTGSGVGTPSGSLLYTMTPAFKVSGVSGTTCNAYIYQSNDGIAYSWQTGIYPSEPVSSGSVTFPSQTPTGTVNLQAAQSLLAVACS
jgi:hypothetical protein